MYRTLTERVQYMIEYYRRMKWHLLPEDLIDMVADEVYDEEGQFAWAFLMDARNYLIRQKWPHDGSEVL